MKNVLIIILLFLVTPIFAQIVDPGKYEVKNVSINTKYSDFGTAFFGKDRVIFASPKEGAMITKTTWGGNNQAFLDLYMANINQEERELENKRKVLGDVNSKFHEGNVAFTKDLKTVYFDANNYNEKGKAVKDSTGTVNIQLYKADVLESGQWKNIVKLPFNNNQFSTGHPTLSIDDKKLYFISDRPGSLGKTDIFVVDILEDGSYSYPKNMGPKINTPEREMFPFISDDNFLYFSSDGHKGYGELDVFASKIFDNTVSEVLNLGEPVNSNKDDFAYIIDDTNHKGYFSSNRAGGKGDDDIYSLVADPPIQIEGRQAISGIVKDVDSGLIIPGATITLLDENGNVIATETLPTELGDWKPYKNTETIPAKDIAVGLGKLEDLSVKKTVDKENPELTENAEFTIDFENKGRKALKNIKLENVIPDGYVYVNDDDNDNIVYDPKTNTITVKELKKGEKLSLNIKTKVLPKEKGAFSFDAISNRNYKVEITAPGYLKETVDVRTANDTDTPPLEIRIKMDPELRIENDKIMVNINTIYFDFDKWNIRPDAAKELDKVIAVMKEHPSMLIEAGSHTDSRAREAYNQILSEKRAKATVDYIVAGGIDRSRITSKGYGEMQLTNNCSSFVKCTREQHQKNRRTEFVIVNDDNRFVQTNKKPENIVVDNNHNLADATETTNANESKSTSQTVNEITDNSVNKNIEEETPPKEYVKTKKDYTKFEQFDGSVIRKTEQRFIKIAPIYFDYDSWSLSSRELEELSKVTNILKQNPKIKIEVQVHTDARNTDKHNLLLSNKRAKSIINYFISRGIKEDRVFGKGFGESVLVNKCKSFVKCTKAQHQENRRIEFVVVDGNNYPSEEIIKKSSVEFINTNPIYFNYDKSNIRKDAAYELDRVVKILKENPTMKIEAGSHTDAINTEAYNQKLSEKRVKSVKDYLVSNGISSDRIVSKGYGESQLINGCSSFVKCTPEQHQENRRTEFKIIER